MTIKIRGKGKNKLTLEFEEEGYSLINLLRHNLWDSDVELNKAEIQKEHTYLDNAKLIVRTEDDDPVEALVSSADRIKDQCKSFKKQLKKI